MFSGKEYGIEEIPKEGVCMCKTCIHRLSGSLWNGRAAQKSMVEKGIVKNPFSCALDTDRLMMSLTGEGSRINTLCGGRHFAKGHPQLTIQF
jgi:hypothetical protein